MQLCVKSVSSPLSLTLGTVYVHTNTKRHYYAFQHPNTQESFKLSLWRHRNFKPLGIEIYWFFLASRTLEDGHTYWSWPHETRSQSASSWALAIHATGYRLSFLSFLLSFLLFPVEEDQPSLLFHFRTKGLERGTLSYWPAGLPLLKHNNSILGREAWLCLHSWFVSFLVFTCLHWMLVMIK